MTLLKITECILIKKNDTNSVKKSSNENDFSQNYRMYLN